MEAAAKSAGITRMAYHNIENGKADPRVKNLQNLANALGVKVFDIVRPVPELNNVRFRARKLGNERARQNVEQIKSNVALWLRDFNNLEDLLNLDPKKKLKVAVSGISDRSAFAKKMAEKAREWFGLEKDEVINDISGLIESAGIKLHFLNLNIDNFWGFSISDKKSGEAIIINNNNSISTERKIFTIAHELGHILMHPDSFDDKYDEIESQEKEADIFAGYFLMPEDAFHKRLKEVNGLHFVDAVLHLKRVFKVSYEAILHRLVKENRASNDIWQKFRGQCAIKYKSNFKGHKEPFPLEAIDCIEDRLSCLVRLAYDKELISRSRAAEILGITVNQMRDRINGWMVVK